VKKVTPRSQGTRPIGSFGKFMMIVEAVGAVPEAMVVF
jgi:hypothetical protein